MKWIQAKREWSPYVNEIIEARHRYADRHVVTPVRQDEGVEIFSVKHAQRHVGPPSEVKIPLSIVQYTSCDCRGFRGTNLVCACIIAVMRND